ncbi:MAG: HupE/UreJ family protein [Bacteroidota bacterium]
MNAFWLWFSTGIEHILDLKGYDHILFVTLLVLTYCFNKWSRLLMLITAFTVGHSVSLALSVINDLRLHQPIVEFLIALSILLSAIYHLVNYKNPETQKSYFLYFIVCFFGLIHGLGFSLMLKSMLGTGQNVILPLLYFNLGLEVGQLIIVLFVVVFSLLLAFIYKFPFKIYKLIVVCLIGFISLKISVERFLELF